MKMRSPKVPAAGEVAAAEGATNASDQAITPDATSALAIVPIRNAVLFPGMVLPLSIGRKSSRQLLSQMLPKTSTLGVFTQKNDDADEATPDDLFNMGVAVKVLRVSKEDEDTSVILVNVLERIRLKRPISLTPFLIAECEVVNSIEPRPSVRQEAALNDLREAALKFLSHKPDVPEQVSNYIRTLADPDKLTDFVCGGLDIPVGEKQALLEEVRVSVRLRKVRATLEHLMKVAELQSKLQHEVQGQFSETQRRAYLHEQMKAIQKELGEEPTSGGDAIAKLREKLLKAKPPQNVLEQAERELARLGSMGQGNAEANVITTYIETLASLPWSVESKDSLDLKRAQRILDADHYGLEKIKRRIIEHLAVRKLKPDGHSPILLLLGPPGVGKTSLGQSIAKALGRKFVRVSLGGVHDEADIRGHRRTYIGAMMGRLMEEIRRAGTKNPVVMLDELDKLGRDFRGDPASALLEVLDPHQNHTFVDHYLDVPFDLSKVLFLATANDLGTIPGPLRDRLEILELSSYTEKEKREIAHRYLVPRQVAEHGLTVEQCEFEAAAIAKVVNEYTREAGVRELERQIGSLCRATAALIASGKRKRVKITPAFVEKTLGPAKFLREARNKSPQPGIVTGLAWTPVGGEILHIEALKFPGTGQNKLTGQLGEVMKESVSAAVSLVRSHMDDLGISQDAFKDTDVHVHVPAGAVPKDGPSAGVAMFTALASLFSDKAVRPDVAMTGEISLRGLVLPIGGLKEKALAALRADITTILAPKGNKKDLADIPEEARKKLKFIWVETVADVLKAALVKPTRQ